MLYSLYWFKVRIVNVTEEWGFQKAKGYRDIKDVPHRT